MARMTKRLRFEVLHRDGFACRYCGAKAPDVQLTVDHVVPVALGGDNDPANLVTACRDCNLGKSSVNPDADTVAQVNADAQRWADAMQEAADIVAQERGQMSQRLEAFADLWPQSRWLPADWRTTITNLDGAGLTDDEMEEAVNVAHSRSRSNYWQYFCGVAWTMVKKRRRIAAEIIESREKT